MGSPWWRTGKKPASSAASKSDPKFPLHPLAEGAEEVYRAGDPCPNCGFARLEYDGYFNVYCPLCGFRTGARGGCT